VNNFGYLLEELGRGKRLGEDVESFQFGPVLQSVIGQQPRHHQNVQAGAVYPQLLGGRMMNWKTPPPGDGLRAP
jgi:hypothetical protein